MGCGEFIAMKLPVSDRYVTESPVGADDGGTASKNGEEKELGEKKENWAAGWELFQTAVVVCREAGEGTGLVPKILKTCW